MSRVTRVYACADGRDFPVEWPSEEDAQLTWRWDPEHNPVPAKPLDQATWTDYRRAARDARLEAGFPEADPFGRGLWFHGFGYYVELPPDPEVSAGIERAGAALVERFGGPLEVWEGWCLPRIEAACRALADAGRDASARELIDRYGYGFEQTFLWFFGGARNALAAFLKTAFGAEDDLFLGELLQGYPTATLEADQALWELGQIARAGGAFDDAFAAFIERYGWRTEDWDPSTPVWRAQPQRVLALVRRAQETEREAPAAAVERAAARREAVAREIEGRLGDERAREEFHRLYAAAATYMTIKEGRAHWQLTLNGRLGAAFRRLGARLATRGHIGDAEDVFYLYPDEIDAGTGPLTGEVARRKAERERWLGAVPPSTIGGEVSGAEPGDEAQQAGVRGLKGTGVSRGRVTAKARLLADVAEGWRLQPGEVLVCATTTPTWTPLFAIAGAIIAAGGGMLSHTAIAAREYGIPAVVGARTATSVIRDGMMVTVDGTTGEVTINA